jgi:hypothetical protein
VADDLELPHDFMGGHGMVFQEIREGGQRDNDPEAERKRSREERFARVRWDARVRLKHAPSLLES